MRLMDLGRDNTPSGSELSSSDNYFLDECLAESDSSSIFFDNEPHHGHNPMGREKEEEKKLERPAESDSSIFFDNEPPRGHNTMEREKEEEEKKISYGTTFPSYSRDDSIPADDDDLEWDRLLQQDMEAREQEDEGYISVSSDEEEGEEEERGEGEDEPLLLANSLKDIPHPITKLEVQNDRVISFLLLIFYGGFILVLATFTWGTIQLYLTDKQAAVEWEDFTLLRLDVYLVSILNLIFLCLVIFYVYKIGLCGCCCCFCPWCPCRKKIRRTTEQRYLCYCLCALYFTFTPFDSFRSAQGVWNGNIKASNPDFVGFANNSSNIAYQIGTQLFIIKMMQHFGYNHANGRNPRKRMIQCCPIQPLDLLVISAPGVVKLVLGTRFRITFDFSPFGNLINLVIFFFLPVSLPMELYFSSFSSVLLDLIAIGYVMRSIQIARKNLGDVPYSINRRKQLGIRFFVSHTITCWIFYTFLNILIVSSTPFGRYETEANRWVQWFHWRFDNDSIGFVDSDSDGLSKLYLLLGQTYGFSLSAAVILIWAFEVVVVNMPLNSRDKLREMECSYIPTEKQASRLFRSKVSPVFCLETSVLLLNFAKLVYSKANEPRDFNEIVMGATEPYPVVRYFRRPKTDTHCIMTTGPDRIIVAFRGTKSIRNLLTDVNVWMDPIEPLLSSFEEIDTAKLSPSNEKEKIWLSMESDLSAHEVQSDPLFRKSSVHKGFLSAYLSIRNEVCEALCQILSDGGSPERSVVVTGHSLGGALATLFAYDISLHKSRFWPKINPDHPLVTCMTFGSPRVGNIAFSKHFNTLVPQCWRIVCNRDIVTQTPLPTILGTGYRHGGIMVLVDGKGNMLVNPSVVERSWWHLSFLQSKITQHLLPTYAKCLGRCIVRSHGELIQFEIWKKDAQRKTRSRADLSSTSMSDIQFESVDKERWCGLRLC